MGAPSVWDSSRLDLPLDARYDPGIGNLGTYQPCPLNRGLSKMAETIGQPETVSDEVRLAEIELARDKARWEYRKAIWVAMIASLGVSFVTGIFQYGQKVREAALEDKKFSNSLKLEESKFDFSSALELRQTSNAYLKDFLNEALGDNLERRVKFAEYFATMTEDDGLRSRWTNYHNRVNKIFLKKIEEEKTKSREKTEEASRLAASKLREAVLLAKIEELENESEERSNLENELASVRGSAISSAEIIATLQREIEILKRDTSPQPFQGKLILPQLKESVVESYDDFYETLQSTNALPPTDKDFFNFNSDLQKYVKRNWNSLNAIRNIAFLFGFRDNNREMSYSLYRNIVYSVINSDPIDSILKSTGVDEEWMIDYLVKIITVPRRT